MSRFDSRVEPTQRLQGQINDRFSNLSLIMNYDTISLFICKGMKSIPLPPHAEVKCLTSLHPPSPESYPQLVKI